MWSRVVQDVEVVAMREVVVQQVAGSWDIRGGGGGGGGGGGFPTPASSHEEAKRVLE